MVIDLDAMTGGIADRRALSRANPPALPFVSSPAALQYSHISNYGVRSTISGCTHGDYAQPCATDSPDLALPVASVGTGIYSMVKHVKETVFGGIALPHFLRPEPVHETLSQGYTRWPFSAALAFSYIGNSCSARSQEGRCTAEASTAYHEPRSRVELFLHPQVYTSFLLISIPPLIGGHAMYALILIRRRWIAIVCLFRSPVQDAVLLVLLVLGPLQIQAGLTLDLRNCTRGKSCASLLMTPACAETLTFDLPPSVRPMGPSKSPRPPNLRDLRVSVCSEAWYEVLSC